MSGKSYFIKIKKTDQRDQRRKQGSEGPRHNLNLDPALSIPVHKDLKGDESKKESKMGKGVIGNSDTDLEL